MKIKTEEQKIKDREYHKKYRIANLERIKVKQKKFREMRKEKDKNYGKNWRLNNPPTEEQRQRAREYAREYRRNNREKCKQAFMRWRKANPEKWKVITDRSFNKRCLERGIIPPVKPDENDE